MHPYGTPSALDPSLDRFRLESFASVSSTNALLKQRALAGEAAGLVLQATEQIQGRGQRQREWVSPPGGLWMSLLFRPQVPAQEVLRWMPESAQKIAQALRTDSGLNVRVKSPNDILVGDKKLCGILAEAESWAGEPFPRFVVLGIGMNVANSVPPGLERPATSLVAEGVPWTTSQARDLVLRALESFLDR